MLKSDRYIPELDGLRGIAVVMVLVWHFVGLPSAGTGVDVLRQITIFGRTGVDLFFVLSGFLITGIIVDHRSSVNLLPAFYSRRALRILPPYVVLIAFFWLTFVLAGPTKAASADIAPVWQQVLAQVTFSWNWLMAVYDGPVAAGFTVTWSVAIEEWFYLVFPIVVILTPPRKLLAILILVAAMSATARAATHAMYPSAKLAP
jgi:peptidoglycan/LPS O-acetylase OafA/YrhL